MQEDDHISMQEEDEPKRKLYCNDPEPVWFVY